MSTSENQLIQKKIFTCDRHGDWEATLIPSFEPGKYINPVCPECIDASEQAQDRLSGQTRQSVIESMIGKAGIAKRFQGKTLENYTAATPAQTKAVSVAARWLSSIGARIASGDSLIFHGSPGTGKSHLAAAIVQGALQAGRTALYLSAYDLIFALRASYRPDAPTFQQEIRNLVYPELLVIDEVGAEVGKGQEDVGPLNAVIDARYRAMRPTIVISNMKFDDLKSRIGERMISRLLEGKGVVVAFDWQDYRAHGGGVK